MHPVIIYFLSGYTMTEKQKAEVEELGVPVRFRNARYIADNEIPEACDGVAGEVPESYADVPSATDAIEAFAKRRAEEFGAFEGSSASHALEENAPPVVKANPEAKPLKTTKAKAEPKKVVDATAWGSAPASKPQDSAATWSPGKE